MEMMGASGLFVLVQGRKEQKCQNRGLNTGPPEHYSLQSVALPAELFRLIATVAHKLPELQRDIRGLHSRDEILTEIRSEIREAIIFVPAASKSEFQNLKTR